MPIEFRCTQCNKLLRTKDESAGKQARCPECSTLLTVPAASTATAAAPRGPAARQSAATGGLTEEELGAANPYSSPRSSKSPRKRLAAVQGELTPTRIEMGDMLGRTWKILKANLGQCILAMIVVLAIAAVAAVVPAGISLLVDRNVAGVIFALSGVLDFALALYLEAGVHLFMLKVARGEDASIGDLFRGGKSLNSLGLASIAFGMMLAAGTLLVVGGLILALMLWPFSYFITDRNAGVVDSFKLAAWATKGNRLTALLIWLTIGLCGGMFTVCTLILGIFVFVPYVWLLPAVMYLAMTGQPTADQLSE